MSVSRDHTSKARTWRSYIRYKDFTGTWCTKTKRGFRTKGEGLEWEREFLLEQSKDLNMNFGAFVEIYKNDIRPNLKKSTMETKEHIVRTKIVPYFQNKSVSTIEKKDILQWQNELIAKVDVEGKHYSQTYLRTIQNQLTAIFNHAEVYYGLKNNPLKKMRKMGKDKTKDEMLFWTKDEFLNFIDTMRDDPQSYYCFELLFYTGLRVGEALALTSADFDFDRMEIRVRKTFSVIREEDYIRTPKTDCGDRNVAIPKFLCDEMKDYIDSLYEIDVNDRIFLFTKSRLEHQRDKGVVKSGVKRIRIHDLRHSSAAYCISLGFTPLELGKRMGHSSEKITELYSHLYPSKQIALIDRMEEDYMSFEERIDKDVSEN